MRLCFLLISCLTLTIFGCLSAPKADLSNTTEFCPIKGQEIQDKCGFEVGIVDLRETTSGIVDCFYSDTNITSGASVEIISGRKTNKLEEIKSQIMGEGKGYADILIGDGGIYYTEYDNSPGRLSVLHFFKNDSEYKVIGLSNVGGKGDFLGCTSQEDLREIGQMYVERTSQ